MIKINDLKIGLLTTYLGSYKEIWPDLKSKLVELINSQIISRIDDSGDIVFPGFVDDIESARNVENEFIKNDVDLILFFALSYTTSNIPVNALRRIKKPIIIVNAQLFKNIDDKKNLLEAMIGNSFLASVELNNVLKRFNKKFFIISGLMNKEDTFREIKDFLNAARVIKLLSKSNMGFIGNSVYEGMMDLQVDEISVKDKFGINIIHMEIGEIISTYKSVKDSQIKALKKELTSKYKDISLTDEQFNNSLRMAVCYRELVEKYKLDCVANYCQTTMYNPEIGIAPCLGDTIMTTSGVPFSCEGDIGAAIALLIMKTLTGNSVFYEFGFLDYERSAIALLHASHGNLNYARKDDDVKILPHPLFEGPCGYGAGFEYNTKEGVSSILNVSTAQNCNWGITYYCGNNIYMEPVGYGFPQSLIKIEMDLDKFVQEWCSGYPSHHVAFAYGDVRSTVARIAELLCMDIKIIN